MNVNCNEGKKVQKNCTNDERGRREVFDKLHFQVDINRNRNFNLIKKNAGKNWKSIEIEAVFTLPFV